ncbi:hypothetical protein ABZ733_30900 [Streptomyces longwoodensis]|uniref:hypothetical protein n=1 Tax=Streptomyces longwoodensis TaxID=68231 RepID=UPI0033C3C1B0
MGHVFLRVLAAVLALVGLSLVCVALWADLDTADKVASVAGACAGFLGCALSVYFEVRRGGSHAHVVQAAGPGAVAAAGNAMGNATASGAKVTRRAVPAPTQAPPAVGQHQVSASGPGSVAAAGDASGNATGASSEVEER